MKTKIPQKKKDSSELFSKASSISNDGGVQILEDYTLMKETSLYSECQTEAYEPLEAKDGVRDAFVQCVGFSLQT